MTHIKIAEWKLAKSAMLSLRKFFHVTLVTSPDNQGNSMTEEPEPKVIVVMDSHSSRLPEDPSISDVTTVNKLNDFTKLII